MRSSRSSANLKCSSMFCMRSVGSRSTVLSSDWRVHGCVARIGRSRASCPQGQIGPGRGGFAAAPSAGRAAQIPSGWATRNTRTCGSSQPRTARSNRPQHHRIAMLKCEGLLSSNLTPLRREHSISSYRARQSMWLSESPTRFKQLSVLVFEPQLVQHRGEIAGLQGGILR